MRDFPIGKSQYNLMNFKIFKKRKNWNLSGIYQQNYSLEKTITHSCLSLNNKNTNKSTEIIYNIFLPMFNWNNTNRSISWLLKC